MVWAIGKRDGIQVGATIVIGKSPTSQDMRLLARPALLKVADVVKDMPGAGLHPGAISEKEAMDNFGKICQPLPEHQHELVIPYTHISIPIANKKEYNLVQVLIETFDQESLSRPQHGNNTIVYSRHKKEVKEHAKLFSSPQKAGILQTARIDYGKGQTQNQELLIIHVQCGGFCTNGDVWAWAQLPIDTSKVKVVISEIADDSESPAKFTLGDAQATTSNSSRQMGQKTEFIPFIQYAKHQLQASLAFQAGVSHHVPPAYVRSGWPQTASISKGKQKKGSKNSQKAKR